MSWSDAEFTEIRAIAANRWREPRAGAMSTWNDWRRSLEHRFDYEDVMASLIMLSEQQERFPSLARLIDRCRVEHDRRAAEERPRIVAPETPATISERLRAFDRSAEETRTLRHGELIAHQRDAVRIGLSALTPDVLAQTHARIDHVGPHELEARAFLLRGGNPGVAHDLLHAWTDALGGERAETPRRDAPVAAAVARDLSAAEETTRGIGAHTGVPAGAS